MAIYRVTRGSTALSTTADLITVIAPSSRTIRIRRISVAGLATASAANVILVQRSTGGTTGGGALTPAPVVTESAASGTVVNTTWSAQPTPTAGVILDRIGVNANGGVNNLFYPPGSEIILRNSEQLSFRSETGTSNVTISLEFDE